MDGNIKADEQTSQYNSMKIEGDVGDVGEFESEWRNVNFPIIAIACVYKSS